MSRDRPLAEVDLELLADLIPFMLLAGHDLKVKWASRAVLRRAGQAVGAKLNDLVECMDRPGMLTREGIEALARARCKLALHGDDGDTKLVGRWMCSADGLVLLGDPDPEAAAELENLSIDDFGEESHLVEMWIARDESEHSMSDASDALRTLKRKTAELEDSRSQLEEDLEERKKGRVALLNILTDMDESKKQLERANASLRTEIAERKRIAKELERASVALDAMIDGVTISDIDGIILEMNRAATVQTGYARDEAVGKNIGELLLFESETASFHDTRDILATGRAIEGLEFRSRRKDGTGYPMSVNLSVVKGPDGKPKEVVAVHRDISEIKAAQEKIAVFLRFVEASGQGMAMASLDGKIVYVNPTLRRILGIGESEDVTGESFFPHYQDQYHEILKEQVLPAVIEGGQWKGELGLLSADGKATPTFEAFFLIRDVKGEPLYMADVITDISVLKKTEAKLTEAMLELERSNRDFEQFAYVASHDLQEPLRMVSSYTQLLAKRYGGRLGPEADEFIGFAVDGADRMKRLIGDLLALSRVDSKGEKLRPTGAEEILGEAVQNLQEAIKDSNAVITHDPLPEVMADHTQFMRLLQNLIGNAIKFHGKDDPLIHVSAKRDGEEWLFSVSDNGIGLDVSYSDRIFQIFQRLHARDEYPGTGIGLSVCKRIVERHGGRIYVESEPGMGATFYFTLKPAAAGSASVGHIEMAA